MQIAIVHYHLRTGGVTRVIEHALEALAGSGLRIVVLSGEAPAEPLPHGTPVVVLEGLGYEEQRARWDGRELARRLRRAAREALGGGPDLWHIHNHSLGKNLAMPGAVQDLARAGEALLLQLHDLAEDGRPHLYRRLRESLAAEGGDPSALLYPLGGRVHYAVLNGRDRGWLAAAGVPAGRLHLLPNAVWLPSPGGGPPAPLPLEAERLWLYPTRAIRRKNIGEFLFWSALAGEGDRFAATQAPANPAEQPVYQRWKAVAEALRLPVTFELGARYAGDFVHLLASAHALVTTSITEGFGLAFLEPWLLGRPLAGRDLPEITRDFLDMGIDLGGLYGRLPVPLDWVGADDLGRRLRTALERSLAAYGRRSAPELEERAWAAWVQDRRVDLGRLDEPLQERALRRLLATPPGERPVAPLRVDGGPARIAHNRARILAELGLERYAERLRHLYGDVAGSGQEPLGAASGEALLDACLAPERLFLLKA